MEKFISGNCSAQIHSIVSYSVLGESKKTVIDDDNSNIEVEREKICLDSSHFLTRLKITNNSGTFAKLYSAYPIISDKFSIGDYSSQNWQIFNGTRQLNDVPGTCVLGVRDASFALCADRLSEEGYVQKDFRTEDSVLAGDMISVIKAGKQFVSLEVITCDNMLNDISISSDYKGFVKALRIDGEINCLLKEGESFYTDWVRICTGGNFLRLLEDYAITRKGMCSPQASTKPKSAIYRITKDISHDNISEKIAFLKGLSAPFEYVELGRGWQECVGDWEPKHDINLVNIASLINKSGFKAGIWTAPLLVEKDSALCKNERKWLLRHADGSACTYSIDGVEYFILDTSSDECLEHIEMMYQKLSAYGFYMHTIDHLNALMVQKDVVLLDPSATLSMIYNRLVKTIRNAVGEDGYLCFENSFLSSLTGVADCVQVSSDINVLSQRSGGNVISKMINQAAMRGFMNDWWHNSSSMVIDGEFTKNYSSPDLRRLMVCEYLNGGMPIVSDLANNEELKLLKCLIPAVKTKTYARDAFNEGAYINVVDVEINDDYHTLCFFNNTLNESEIVFALDSETCGGYVDHSVLYNVSSYFGRMKKRNVSYGEIVRLGTVQPFSCEIVKIAKGDVPQIILSDMHFSMGGEVDIQYLDNTVKISGNNPFNSRGNYVVALPGNKTMPDGNTEFSFTVNGAGPFVYERTLR